MRKKKELEEAENDFNVDAAIHGFAVGAYRGTHLPVSHGRHGLFFQAESGALENPRVENAPVRCDDHVKQHASLVLGLARLVRVIGIRAVDAGRLPDAIDAGAKFPAARTAA